MKDETMPLSKIILVIGAGSLVNVLVIYCRPIAAWVRRIPRIGKVITWREKRARENPRPATHAKIAMKRQSALAWWLVVIDGGLLVIIGSSLGNLFAVFPNTCEASYYLRDSEKSLIALISVTLFGALLAIISATAPSIIAHFRSERRRYNFPSKPPVGRFGGLTENSLRKYLFPHLICTFLSMIFTAVVLVSVIYGIGRSSQADIAATWSRNLAACRHDDAGPLRD